MKQAQPGPIPVRIDFKLYGKIKILAAQKSLEEGKRVLIGDLLNQAMRDYLKRNGVR